jgi:hypothetical protein
LNDNFIAVIWDKALAGKFIRASTTNRDDLDIVTGVTTKSGFLVIKPDIYGMKGESYCVDVHCFEISPEAGHFPDQVSFRMGGLPG